jgi:isopentenyl-diphosphate delta-isomerase
MNEFVILVDDQDKEIGIEEKIAAHQNGGKRHRAFSILIFNNKGELMLQQRAFKKYHCGGLWTNTCCSHPRPGEEILSAAHRRLQEEMGFDCELKEIFEFNYTAPLDHDLTENEHDHVFVGYYDLEPNINPLEAESWKWISIADLNEDIKNNPQNYTFWFKVILKEFNNRL